MRVGLLTMCVLLAGCEAQAPIPAIEATHEAAPEGAPAVTISFQPQTPLIERTAFGQALNFDIRIGNTGAAPLTLRAVQVTVRNKAGEVVQVSEINDNGPAPGIGAVTGRDVAAGEGVTVFNPLHTLAADIDAAALDYRLEFISPGGQEIAAELRAAPQTYVTKTALRLPVQGRVLVWDGHDFYAHHRRLSLDAPPATVFGLSGNANRYSYDFTLVDEQARRFTGDGKAHETHFSFGQAVVAPGDGVVVAAVDAFQDNGELTDANLQADLMNLFGNHVVIDHGNGEFSRLGHLKSGSVKVKTGQQVKAGDQIGEMGSSGSSLFPHLHYELATGPDMKAEGLPSTFRNLDRLLGAKRAPMDGVSPDSGDIIADRAAKLVH